MVASGSDDKTIKLWDAKTGKELQTLEGHSGKIMSVDFSPDSQTVASRSLGSTIKLWDAETGKELQTLEGHPESVASVVGQISHKPNPQVSIAFDWIAFRNENVIWLPAEYREFHCSAIQDGTLALGYANRRVLIVGFQTD
jgi:WD40 repeat protein